MSKEGKQYGLIMPKKPQLSAPRAGNIFGDDNDSDQDEGVDWVKKALKAEGEKHRVKKQTKLNMERALNEDPTIYQYDEIYDDLEKSKGESKANVKKEVKKPKYIHNLIKNAERRKLEQEHRIERMVQKERETEGEMFADKESFVTSAYRAKLEEIKKMEEEEDRMSRLEAIADVTKQQDMSGFYRQFFAQTVGNDKTEESNENEGNPASSNLDKDDDISSDSDSNSERHTDSDRESVDNKHEETKIISKRKKGRQYRQRVMEESESESEAEEKSAEEDSGDSENNTNQTELESPAKRIKLSTEEEDKKKEEPTTDNTEAKSDNFKIPEVKLPATVKDSKTNDDIAEVQPEKKKVSIWEKRTVGPVFEAALQRYYERKAMRLSGS